MADIHKMGDDVAKGFQSHDQALIGKLCENVQSWGKDGHHTQEQINTNMQALSKDLHARGILQDLEIVGADGKNHELIAKDAHNKTVLIDDSGNRSDSARQMGDKQGVALKVICDSHGQDSSAAKRFMEGQRMMQTEMRQLPSMEHVKFEDQVYNWMGQDTKMGGATRAVISPNGQNYRHSGGGVMI